MVKKERIRKRERKWKRRKERKKVGKKVGKNERKQEGQKERVQMHTSYCKWKIIVIWRQKIIWRQLNLEAQNVFTTQILSRQINTVESNLNVQNQRFPMKKT